jgi:hypothetical protein
MRKRSSPKGLVSTTIITPEQKGWRQVEVGPGTALKGPDFDEELKKAIEGWRRFAKGHIKEESASNDVLDRTAAAKEVLKRLDLIELYSRDPGAARYLYQGVLLASKVHQLAIVDNEAPIAERVATLGSFSRERMDANAKRKADASREHKKWQAEADRIQKGRQRPMSRLALAQRMKDNLGLEEKVGTIRKIIK